MTTVDLTPIVNALLGLAAAMVAAAIPILVPFILKRLHLANNAELAQRMETAADAAAGAAYNYALQHEGGLSHVAVHDAALGAGLAHMTASVPDAMKVLGITPEAAKSMVTARLGALLAADPTVSAGRPAQVPAAAPVEPPAVPVPPPAP